MWIIAGCAALCLLVCLPLFFHYKNSRRTLAVCFKCMGTCCALIPALTAALRLDPVFGLCALALALHCVADAVLEFRFVHGMGFFLLGHLCYLIYFLKRFPMTSPAPYILCFVGLAAAFGLLLWLNRKAVGKSGPAFIVYGTVLALMSACGMGSWASSYLLPGLLTALGAALFAFSDALLFWTLFHASSRQTDWIILITYYAAQLLLGSACLL